jgi:hypothetical protein
MFSTTERGSVRYDKWGTIKILDVEWGESKSGDNGSSHTPPYGRGGTPPYGDTKDGLGAVGVAVVALVVLSANDVYFHRTESQNYGGYNFGLRNSMSRHLDIEMGLGHYTAHNTHSMPSEFFVTDYPYWGDRSSVLVWDINAVYNILRRSSVVNPYIGIGISGGYPFVSGLDGYDIGGAGLGPIVGFSAGLWKNRIQFHARYKWLKNFDYPAVLAGQVELGLTVKYKRGWKFSRQTFIEPEYDDLPNVRFAIQSGLTTASASAKVDGHSWQLTSRTGYSLMLYMRGMIADSPWAINWGMIGVSSLGWTDEYDNQDNFYYLPMSLGTSYQINIIPGWLSILPSAGVQCGILVDNNRYNSKELRKFDIGPTFGGAIQINKTLEIGAQYDIGLLNVFKQGDENSYTGVKACHRGLQFFTRMFF